LVIDVPIRGAIIHPIVDPVILTVIFPSRDINDLLEERTNELFRSFLEGIDLARVAVIMGQAKVLAVNLIGHFVDIPTGERVTLARLPALPVIPVDEHRLPLAIVVGPLGRTLKSTHGIVQARTVFWDVSWTVLIRSWPSPGRLPGSVRTVIVPLLDDSVSCYRLSGGDSAGEAGNDESSERDERG
ncbi:hypothetical protein IW261DRAFT_1517275, partial [Armillaria novae-zelandiae]